MAVRTLTTCPTRVRAIVDEYAEAAIAMKEAKEKMDLYAYEIRQYFLSIRADYDNPTSLKLKGNDRVLMCTQKNAWIFNQADIDAIREIIPEHVEEKTTYKLIGMNRDIVMSNSILEELIKPQAASLSAK